MKKFILATVSLTFGLFNFAIAQQSGNANYNNNYKVGKVNAIQTTSGNTDEMLITIKGIYNEKASAQIATFSVLQLGKTAKEANDLIVERIANVTKELSVLSQEMDVVVDMISFVPRYDYTVQKKIFNPKTYNEVPSGFELRKNIIIKFKKTDDLEKIVAICSKNEIYDLVKVDYITNNLNLIRAQLQKKALEEFKTNLTNYAMIMNTDLNKKEKTIQEGFNVIYPMESYRTYQAFAKASIIPSQLGEVNEIDKSETQYYNPALAKEHSFVINADITEPCIQIFYDLTIRIKLKEDQLPKNTIIKNNKYYIITATGEIKPLQL